MCGFLFSGRISQFISTQHEVIMDPKEFCFEKITLDINFIHFRLDKHHGECKLEHNNQKSSISFSPCFFHLRLRIDDPHNSYVDGLITKSHVCITIVWTVMGRSVGFLARLHNCCVECSIYTERLFGDLSNGTTVRTTICVHPNNCCVDGTIQDGLKGYSLPFNFGPELVSLYIYISFLDSPSIVE